MTTAFCGNRKLSTPSFVIFWFEMLRDEIRTATSSMTSVPKPLKFLRPHYDDLKSFFESMMDSDHKALFSDVLSVLAMTMAGSDAR
jgi:26S proteasome regulatory subunit N1